MRLDDVSAIADVPFFADVPFDDVRDMAEVLQVLDLADGEVLIREGDTDECIYFVLSGEIAVSSRASGSVQEIEPMGRGQLLGLLSLVDNAPRPATCTAAGNARVARLQRGDYKRLTDASIPLTRAFHRAIGKQLARDFRQVTRRLTEVLKEGSRHEPQQDGVDFDVAVIGAGPLGMMYAQWVRKMAPESRVVMIERRAVPGYKVGESTLSTTVRAFLDMGFTMPQMRRLFGNKAGLRFWWAGPESERPEREVDVVDLEETFQIERRIFEMALQRLTRERGVDIRVGTQVELADSRLEGPVKVLTCSGPDGEYVLRARMVCDATGPAAVLQRQMGTYRKAPDLHDSFQTNCYFGYFRQKAPLPLKRWDEPATRHLCFPEGWIWFISLHSWEDADDETALALVNDVLDHKEEDDAALPSRRELADRHGTDFSLLTSIGITVREDKDTAKDLPIQKRFEHYVERYPVLRWILDHYELVEQPYREKRRPYAAFLGLAHDSTQVAGDGWIAIGDAAQFTNPLFSHGINYGSGTAYMAAVDTARALRSGDVRRASFKDYEDYCSSMYPVLLHTTDFFYRSFAHPLSFERTLMANFHWGVTDVAPRREYSETDPFVFDPLNPEWTGLVERVREVEKRYDAGEMDAETMAREVKAIVDPFNAACLVESDRMGIKLGSIFNNYLDDGTRVENRTDKPRGDFKAYRCETCSLWQDDTLKACPVCGTPNPAPWTPPEPDPPGGGGGSGGGDGGGGGGSGTTDAPMESPSGTGAQGGASSDMDGHTTTATGSDTRGRGSSDEGAPDMGSSPGGGEAATPSPALTPSRAERRRLRPIAVAEVIEETPQSRTIRFDIPRDQHHLFGYRAGQFLTLEVDMDGESLRRCYSLSSAPSCDDRPAITVKRIEGGRVSNWLCDHVRAGTSLSLLPPDGRFTLSDDPGELFLFAAGSGITPVWSIAREALATTDRNVRLVYVNRSDEETIFRTALEDLRRRHRRRFKVVRRTGHREGRLDTRDVQAYCDARTDGHYFMCGPWGFMDVVEEGLLDMGVPPERIHIERFASPRAARSEPDEADDASAMESAPSAATTIAVDLFGERCEIVCQPGQKLSDAALAAGVELPTSCEEGYCGTCLCHLAEGEMGMAVDDALTKGQKKRGMLLACQAIPRSATARVVFSD